MPEDDKVKVNHELAQRLKRDKPKPEDQKAKRRTFAVSAGEFGSLIDGIFNTSREKMPEFTVITPQQGQIFPFLSTLNKIFNNCIEVATYRQSPDVYKAIYNEDKPKEVDVIDEFLFSTAQWQKSIRGKTLDAGTDLIKTDMETKAREEAWGETDAGEKMWADK